MHAGYEVGEEPPKEYYDDLTMKKLDPEKCRKARQKEIDQMNEFDVVSERDESEIPEGEEVYDTKFMDVEKVDNTTGEEIELLADSSTLTNVGTLMLAQHQCGYTVTSCQGRLQEGIHR